MVHAGCFSVSIIHRTLTWTTGSLMCAQMLMYMITHRGLRTHVRESALKVDPGRKIPCPTRESNLHQQCDGPMLYQWATSPPLMAATLQFFCAEYYSWCPVRLKLLGWLPPWNLLQSKSDKSELDKIKSDKFKCWMSSSWISSNGGWVQVG